MKTLKNIAIIIILTLGQANLLKAQSHKLHDPFDKLLEINNNFYRSDTFYDKSIVLSISIGVNKTGMVDTVIYSGGNDNVDIGRLFNLKKITAGLKANKTDFRSNKNEFVVLMVMVVRGDENFITIKNGNQILENWISIVDNSNSIVHTGKRQIFLPPILFYSRGKSIIDRLPKVKQ